MSLNLPKLDDVHAEVRRGIAAGEPGLAQIVLGQTISIICRDGVCSPWGTMPADATYRDICNAIIDDLVDDTVDNRAIASRQGVLARSDFITRAEHYETRYLFPPKRDLEFAKKIRAFAATWPAG